MYSSKQFILAAMLNNVFKNCKLLEDCIYIHYWEDRKCGVFLVWGLVPNRNMVPPQRRET